MDQRHRADLDVLIDDELHPGQADAIARQLPPTQRGRRVGHVRRDFGACLQEGSAQTAPTRSQRILVIEDNLDFGNGLKRLLEQRGHEVVLAHDGPSGLSAAESHRPDVEVLDIDLPVSTATRLLLDCAASMASMACG